MKFSSTLPGFVLAFALALSSLALSSSANADDPRTVHFTYKDMKGADGVLDVTPSYRSRLVTIGGKLVDIDDDRDLPPLEAGAVRCEIYKYVERSSGSTSNGTFVSSESFSPISTVPIGVLDQTTIAARREHWAFDEAKPGDGRPAGTESIRLVSSEPILDTQGHQIYQRDLKLPASSGLELVRCQKGGAAPTDAEMNASMQSVVEVAVVAPVVDAKAQLASIRQTLQSWWTKRQLHGASNAATVAASKVERDEQAARPAEPPAAVLVDSDADAGVSLPGGTGGAVPSN